MADIFKTKTNEAQAVLNKKMEDCARRLNSTTRYKWEAIRNHESYIVQALKELSVYECISKTPIKVPVDEYIASADISMQVSTLIEALGQVGAIFYDLGDGYAFTDNDNKPQQLTYEEVPIKYRANLGKLKMQDQTDVSIANVGVIAKGKFYYVLPIQEENDDE